MKRLGFTLSEVIIALGIIGVIAAITAPLIVGIMPDKDKVKVLKVYKTINDITQELINNPGIYMSPQGKPYKCVGIACTEKPVLPQYNDDKYSNKDKFAYLFVEHLELEKEPTIYNNTFNFKTKDGIAWERKCKYGMGYRTGESLPYSTQEEYITIDLNDSKTPNCLYNMSSCKKPDRFKFIIDETGKVTGSDPLTKAYLGNPHKLNDRKKDYARAKELSSN